MDPSLVAASDRLLGALGNGILQGLLLTALLALALRAFCRANAATRHALHFTALLTVAALPVAHALLDPRLPANAPPSLPEPPNPGISSLPDPSDVSDLSDLSDKSSKPAIPLVPAPSPAWSWHLALPPWMGVTVLLGWMALAGLRLARLAAQCLVLARWKRAGQAAPAPLVRDFEELRRDLGIRRPVTLRICPDLASPVAVGYRRPAVLIPPEEDSPDGPGATAWNRVLRHELAHLRRGDDWTNLVQQVAVAVFFFHPAILWLSRRLTLEREVACDDHVLAARVPRREYALLLTDLARRMRNQPWSAAPAVWSNPSQLRERIHMILDSKRNASPGIARGRTGAGIAALTLATALTLLATPRLTVARADSPVPPEPPGTSADAAPPPTPPAEPAAIPNAGIAAVAPDLLASGDELPSVPAAPPAPAAAPPELPPMPPMPPRSAAAPRDASELAERLERLERLVEALAGPGTKRATGAKTRSLVAAGVAEGKGHALELRRGGADDFRLESPAAGKPATPGSPHPEIPFEASSQNLDQAAREIESAARQAELAARSAEKSARTRLEAGKDDSDRARLAARRHALDEQRRMLQKQIRQMEAQLGQLEAQFDRVEAEFDREEARGDIAREHPGAPAGQDPTRLQKDRGPVR